MWVSRFIKWSEQQDKNIHGKIIQRTPQAQDEQRAAVTPERIARYFHMVFQELDDKKIRAVKINANEFALY
jgi:hypothetical protein